MAKTATGVMDKPAKATKATKTATAPKKPAKEGSRRRKTGAIREVSTKTADSSSKKTSKSSTKAISSSKELAIKGEEAAARFLYRRGYEILERNWSCFAGEADIIAKDGDTIVFAEVKTRKDAAQGFPSEATSEEKKERFEKIALAYLSEQDTRECPIRFDVISLVVIGSDKAMIRHQINAFSLCTE